MNESPRVLSIFGGVVLLGQERGNLEALIALKKQGCDVLCLIRDEDWITRIPEAMDREGLAWRKLPFLTITRPAVQPTSVARNIMSFVTANIALLKIVKEFRPTHIHAFNQVNVLTFLPALALTSVPLVYRAGDEPVLHNWLWRMTWRFIRRRTARFVAISRYVAGVLERLEVDPSRISQIYSRPPTRDVIDSEAALPSSCDTWIVYVGQITRDKGVDVAIEALRKLASGRPRLGLVILGRISDWEGDRWAKELRETVENDRALEGRVHFAGEVEDVGSFFRRARVHVMPSVWQEPLGNVVLEAKAAGVPTVAFPTGGLPELIESGVDGEVCSAATAGALAEALARYVDDPEFAAAHGRAARQSLKRLGNDRFGEDWMKVLSQSAAI